MERPFITISLSKDDYLEGSLFAARWTRKRWLIVGLMAAVYLGLGAFMVFYAPRELFVLGCTLIGAVVGGIGGSIISHYIFLPRRLRSRFAERKALHRKSTLSWDEKGLTLESENGHSLIPWPDFFKFRENEHFILLYASRVIYLLVPKRFFTEPGQLNDLLGHVRSRIGVHPAVDARSPSYGGGRAT